MKDKKEKTAHSRCRQDLHNQIRKVAVDKDLTLYEAYNYVILKGLGTIPKK